MIKENIKVEYMRHKKTGKIAFNINDLIDTVDELWDVENLEFNYRIFLNSGKVANRNRCEYEEVNREAERLLAERLAIKADAEKDMERGKELAKIVNEAMKDKNIAPIDWDMVDNGDFSDDLTPGWVTIKVKTSHSKWYQNDIENVPSTYHYQVPVEVEKEARELQSIRRKHQDDENFSFYQTNYLKREVRVADHYNY